VNLPDTLIKGSQALLFIRVSILEQENKLQLLKLLYMIYIFFLLIKILRGQGFVCEKRSLSINTLQPQVFIT